MFSTAFACAWSKRVKFLVSLSVSVALPREHLQHFLVAALVELEQQVAHPGCVSL